MCPDRHFQLERGFDQIINQKWQPDVVGEEALESDGAGFDSCYQMDVCVPPKLICKSLNPCHDSIRSWSLRR
jgi:hypothetical protein